MSFAQGCEAAGTQAIIRISSRFMTVGEQHWDRSSDLHPVVAEPSTEIALVHVTIHHGSLINVYYGRRADARRLHSNRVKVR